MLPFGLLYYYTTLESSYLFASDTFLQIRYQRAALQHLGLLSIIY